MPIDPEQIALNPEQQKRLAVLAEQMGKDWRVLVDTLFNTLPFAGSSQAVVRADGNGERLSKMTLYDVLLERGMLGCFDGPSDLSTNPKHMEGFGEPRYPKNSH